MGNSPNASAAIWDSSHTLVATWSAPAQPRFSGLQQLAGGSIQLNGIGLSNLSYTVWANTNLATTNWVAIGSAAAVGANLQFVDLNATNFTCRFYRLSQP